jgi:hypothetical protein
MLRAGLDLSRKRLDSCLLDGEGAPIGAGTGEHGLPLFAVDSREFGHQNGVASA